jgi:hypothetical protein
VYSVRVRSQHGLAMLYATLICTDPDCAEELEAWGEPEQLEVLLCVSCGCQLQPLAFCEVRRGTVSELPRRTPHVQLRAAA